MSSNNENDYDIRSNVTEAKDKLADVQISSEGILKDAYDMKNGDIKRPSQKIQDLEELRSYQLNKRREFEQHLNKNRLNYGQWLRYARWEIDMNHDFARARSIFERALEVDVEHIPFWTHYVQFELTHRNINHARNLLDRGVTVLPMRSKLWFLYVQTEETLKNYDNVRTIFERWLTWKPSELAWDAYISFELRYDEYENCRNIYRRYVNEFRSGKTWLQWIDFETKELSPSHQSVPRIRRIFELCVDTLLHDPATRNDPELAEIFDSWATWEASTKEYERAHAIYRELLNNENISKLFSREQRLQFQEKYTTFEKIHGNKENIEESIVMSRKMRYEAELSHNPNDYDTWWKYIKIFENDQNEDLVRIKFHEAFNYKPSDNHKSIAWRRYVFLYIKCALWEEFTCRNAEGAREAWNKCLSVIPHAKFTFAKIWFGLAQFEIRNDEENGLTKARKLLGKSIGQSCVKRPKTKIFKNYISLEKTLGEWKRVRMLYEKWLETTLTTQEDEKASPILLEYINFEREQDNEERCEALYKLGLQLYDMQQTRSKFDPIETVWKSLVEFYKEEFKYNEARDLLNDLAKKYEDPNIWISLAIFESSIPTPEQFEQFQLTDEDIELEITDTHRENSRDTYKRANQFFKDLDRDEERAMILRAWKRYEMLQGTTETQEEVEQKMPRVVEQDEADDKMERKITYVFPEDEKAAQEQQEKQKISISKFMANAQQWVASQK